MTEQIEDQQAYDGFLFEERIDWFEHTNKFGVNTNEMKSIREAFDRDCYLHEPWFPSEE